MLREQRPDLRLYGADCGLDWWSLILRWSVAGQSVGDGVTRDTEFGSDGTFRQFFIVIRVPDRCPSLPWKSPIQSWLGGLVLGRRFWTSFQPSATGAARRWRWVLLGVGLVLVVGAFGAFAFLGVGRSSYELCAADSAVALESASRVWLPVDRG